MGLRRFDSAGTGLVIFTPYFVKCPAEGKDNDLEATLSLNSVVVATKEQVSCALGDESAILNMKNSVYYGMDAVGSRIWNLLQQPRSVSDVCDTIQDEYEVERERCERDLLELLEKMRGEGLIEVTNVG